VIVSKDFENLIAFARFNHPNGKPACFNNHSARGKALGYPECCIKAFEEGGKVGLIARYIFFKELIDLGLDERIDELVGILMLILQDLEEIKEALGSVGGEAKPESLTIDDVQRVFPDNLAGTVYFEETDEHIIVRPRGYLGPDTFKEIAGIVRDRLGGDYVSAGRDSHFLIPRRRK